MLPRPTKRCCSSNVFPVYRKAPKTTLNAAPKSPVGVTNPAAAFVLVLVAAVEVPLVDPLLEAPLLLLAVEEAVEEAAVPLADADAEAEAEADEDEAAAEEEAEEPLEELEELPLFTMTPPPTAKGELESVVFSEAAL